MKYLPDDPMLFHCKVCDFVGPERHVHRRDMEDPKTEYVDDERAGPYSTAVWVFHRKTATDSRENRG